MKFLYRYILLSSGDGRGLFCLADGVGTRAISSWLPLLTFGNKGRLCLRNEVKIVPLFQKRFPVFGPLGAKRPWVTRRYCLL